MDEKCIGCVISADTSDGSVYQGKLTAVDAHNGSITMASVCKNGIPLHRCETLFSAQIVDLRVIRAPPTSSNPTTSSCMPSSKVLTSSVPPSSKQQQQQAVKNQRPLKKPVNMSLSSASSSIESDKLTDGGGGGHMKLLLPPKSKGAKTPERKFAANVEKLFEQHAAQSPAGKSPNTRGNLRHSKRQSPEKNGFTHVTEEISATPMFKSFEPQIPQPKVLSSIAINGSGGSSSSRKQGPSGNPVLDALNHYKGIGRRSTKTDLAEPIDFDLDSDFDFAENLKLFERDEEDDEYYENVEKLKVSQNFAHYENIVDDVERVTSWTNLKAKSAENQQKQKMEKKSNIQLTAVSFEKSMDGSPIPAISAMDKKEFMKECKSSLSEAVFDTITADRVFQWVSEIQLSHGDSSGTILLLASASNSVRSIRRLLTHFDKRRYNCHLFGKYPGEHFEYVNVVDDVKMLPRQAPIICLLSPDINEDVESWLRIQHESTHYICIEHIPSMVNPSNCHLLQFGCATNGLRHVEQRKQQQKLLRGATTFEQLCGRDGQEHQTTVLVDSAIADLGNPSNWFDDCSSKFISTAFATTFLIRLSRS